MYAILKIIEATVPKDEIIFVEAVLIFPQDPMEARYEKFISRETALKLIPFGSKTDANGMKLALLNHCNKEGFTIAGIESASLKKGKREINFYLQIPENYKFTSK